MQQLELISHALLWIVVIIEGVLLLALARQIGLLHQRLGSGGARIMNVGLTIGETVPIPNEIYDIDNQRFTLAIERGKRTLLLFISTTCSTCSSLMPQLKKLSHFERDNLEIKVVAFHSMVEAGRKYTIDHGLAEADIVSGWIIWRGWSEINCSTKRKGMGSGEGARFAGGLGINLGRFRRWLCGWCLRPGFASGRCGLQ